MPQTKTTAEAAFRRHAKQEGETVTVGLYLNAREARDLQDSVSHIRPSSLDPQRDVVSFG